MDLEPGMSRSQGKRHRTPLPPIVMLNAQRSPTSSGSFQFFPEAKLSTSITSLYKRKDYVFANVGRLSYKVRREQVVGTDDVKVTAMNMYKFKEGLRFCKRWPCSTYI